MSVKIKIPQVLRKFTEGNSEVELEVQEEGVTLFDLISSLEKKYSGIQPIITKNNRLNRFVNFYVDNEDVRFLKNEYTIIKDGSEILIQPAIAGGCERKLAYSFMSELGRFNLSKI